MNSLSSMQPSDATWWDLAPDMVNSPIGAELEPFPYNIQVDTQFCFPPRSDVGLLPFSGSRGPSGYESDAGFGGIEQDPRFWDAMLQTPVGASFLDVPSAPWSPSGSDAGSLLASRRSSLASSSGSSSYGSPYMTPYTPLPGPYDFDHFEYDPAFLAASTPSPASLPSPSAPALSPTTATRTKRRSRAPPGTTKSCSHCAATTTPLWRRHPGTRQPLCNACGLYLAQRGSLRPDVLIECDAPSPSSAPSPDSPLSALGMQAEQDDDYTGPECSHCKTRKTSVWRRSATGQRVCNACGVYARLRGRERPLKLRLKSGKVRPRQHHPKAKAKV